MRFEGRNAVIGFPKPSELTPVRRLQAGQNALMTPKWARFPEDAKAVLAKLDMVEAFRPVVKHLEGAAQDAAWMGYLDGYNAGWKAAGKRGEPPEVTDEDLTADAERVNRAGTTFSDVLDQIAVGLAGRARTTRDGLAAFAENELGLPLNDLLLAWGKPALGSLAAHAEALDAAEADAEQLDLSRRVMDLAWRWHGLNDRTAEPDDEVRAAVEKAGW